MKRGVAPIDHESMSVVDGSSIDVWFSHRGLKELKER
jgi:hypothetical protein